MSSRRRVLIVSHSLSGGGAERVTSLLLGGLDREQIEPYLAVCFDRVTYSLPTDVPVLPLGQQGLFSTNRTVRRLAAVIDDLRPDVVLSNVDYTTLFTGLALRRTKHRPRWIARLGLNPRRESFSWLDSVSRFFLRRMYPRVDQFVANSQGLGDCFAEEFGIPREKIEIIYNPVDIDELNRLAALPPVVQRDPNVPLVIFAGRLHRQKRPELFVEALRLVTQRRPVQGWLLGDGKEFAAIERQILAAGLKDSVRCLGFQANPFPLVAQGDIFVLCSDHEGLPNALLEAQSLGLPAVATRCPFGPEEIIREGETGTLVPCGDATTLAAAIEALLADGALRKQMSQAARTSIRERFALPPIIAAWNKLLT